MRTGLLAVVYSVLAVVYIVILSVMWAVGGWPVAVVVASGYALLGCILYLDRRTRISIEANVADAVRRRDRLLGRQ
jgi:hypothetical protein